MILVLHACLPTLWVVIMRHVEPGEERKRRGVGLEMERGMHNTHSDYQLLNGSVVARRINLKRFPFSHF